MITGGYVLWCTLSGPPVFPPAGRLSEWSLAVNVLPLDPLPCPHPPGSPEKVACLIRRHACGFALWHPDDAHADPPIRPSDTRTGRPAGRPRRSHHGSDGRLFTWHEEPHAFWRFPYPSTCEVSFRD